MDTDIRCGNTAIERAERSYFLPGSKILPGDLMSGPGILPALQLPKKLYFTTTLNTMVFLRKALKIRRMAKRHLPRYAFPPTALFLNQQLKSLFPAGLFESITPLVTTVSLLKRAQAGGYEVLVTLDVWALSWRPWDLGEAHVPFIKGVGNKAGFTDPVFRRKFEKYGTKVEDKVFNASKEWVGRQLDGAVGSLEMLPEIVDAVGDKLTVLFDSGIRTGVDITKALSVGAKGVLIRRPAIYGLSIAGKNIEIVF
ncbi:hypothetical protein G7Y89_g1990 [Cudoniella acicularis]|uniref:FMN hydroxy acid dehydrogenase domain-containing protein n=1 Tax=Cudoniella acicularis TaxID=354080 RepID=A0A8H4W6H7_9HELO|nr:hypothetical protein G7Y89_g1990 [Cudoniella acicularis]